jgi:hypothetical protein
MNARSRGTAQSHFTSKVPECSATNWKRLTSLSHRRIPSRRTQDVTLDGQPGLVCTQFPVLGPQPGNLLLGCSHAQRRLGRGRGFAVPDRHTRGFAPPRHRRLTDTELSGDHRDRRAPATARPRHPRTRLKNNLLPSGSIISPPSNIPGLSVPNTIGSTAPPPATPRCCASCWPPSPTP